MAMSISGPPDPFATDSQALLNAYTTLQQDESQNAAPDPIAPDLTAVQNDTVQAVNDLRGSNVDAMKKIQDLLTSKGQSLNQVTQTIYRARVLTGAGMPGDPLLDGTAASGGTGDPLLDGTTGSASNGTGDPLLDGTANEPGYPQAPTVSLQDVTAGMKLGARFNGLA